jgi:hypothetical protein
MTTISTDDDLTVARHAFKPEPGTKIEFNVNNRGVAIVANREGWLTLANWCLVMAHPEMENYLDPFELTGEVLSKDLFTAGDVILSFQGITGAPVGALYQDVVFKRSDKIGPEYWEDGVPSGNSRYVKSAVMQSLDSFRWLEGKTREEAEAQLGKPIFEIFFEDKCETLVAYKADTTAGWMGIHYDIAGDVSSFGYGNVPPWEDTPIGAHTIVVAHKDE